MAVRRLTLLRHGHAEAIDSCAEDFERALTRRGALEARAMAARMVRKNLIPDLILVSPAERAWATASLIAQACDMDGRRVQCVRELYLAAPEAIWRVLRRQPASAAHILLCGHNPGLSQVASRFGPRTQRRDLPTAGLATAAWHGAPWATLEPEGAGSCDMDDPENMDDPYA